MIIGPDYVFIAVPRTASVSIASWLVAEHGGIWHGDHHGTEIPPQHRGKFTFTVVRNPFTRLPSMYRYVAEKFWPDARWRESAEAADWREMGMPFDCDLTEFVDWAETQHGHQWCSQSRLLEGVRLNAVPKFEFLPTCLSGLYFMGEPGPVNLPNLNPTGRAPVLTQRERDAIRSHSREDFEGFHYAAA